MHFKITSVVGLLAIITPALASAPVVEQIQQITLSTANVRDILKGVSPVTLLTKVPEAINTYQSNVIKPKTSTVSGFPSTLEAADQAALCENYVNFATTSEDLMNVLIGKEGLLSITPFKDPVAALLRVDESITDTLSIDVLGVASSCADKIKDPKQRLEKAYKTASDKYDS